MADNDNSTSVAEQTPDQEAAASPPETASPGTRLTAQEIYENVRLAAEEDLKRPAAALLWSSLAAGLTIGFSFLAAAYLTMFVSERSGNLAAAAGYPLGFMFVVLARNQLFTENTHSLDGVVDRIHAINDRTVVFDLADDRTHFSVWVQALDCRVRGGVLPGSER